MDASEKVAGDARRLRTALGAHKDLSMIPCTKYWHESQLQNIRNDWLGLEAPTISMLLSELEYHAEYIRQMYMSRKSQKLKRRDADQTLFLTQACQYLCHRYATATTYSLTKVADDVMVSAFPAASGTYEDRAKEKLKEIRRELSKKKKPR